MGDALTLLLLATGGLLAIVILASVVDVLLGRLVAAGRISRPEIHLSIVVDAPIARAWELLSDIDRQPEWMQEMKQVTMLTPPPVGVGSRGRATVRIFGIGTTEFDRLHHRGERITQTCAQKTPPHHRRDI